MLAEAAKRGGVPRLAPVIAVVLAGVLGVVVLMAIASMRDLVLARGSSLDDFGPAPAFILTDQLGRTVRSDDLRGRVALASFVFTHCRETCPVLTARMRALQDRLRREGLLGGQVQLLSLAVDPARDTVPVLGAYAAQHHADPEAWRFLTGPDDQMRQLIVEGFYLGVLPVTFSEAVPDGHAGHEHRHDYDVMHSNRVVLIDPQGHIRAYYDGLEMELDRVIVDVRSLLR